MMKYARTRKKKVEYKIAKIGESKFERIKPVSP